MARKKKAEEQSGGASWLNTYADMVTLVLTFFVLLYSMSSIDVQKFSAMAQSMAMNFNLTGGTGILEGYTPVSDGDTREEPSGNQETLDELLQYMRETEQMRELQNEFNEMLAQNQLQDTVNVSLDERGLIIRFQDSILFTSGSADLLPQSYAVLNEVVAMLQGIRNHVRVEGHSDNIPINTARYPSNWELSTSRSTNVVRFLINNGLSSDRLSALGYAEFRPVVSNDTSEGRAKNRRVDIVIIRDSLARQEPGMME